MRVFVKTYAIFTLAGCLLVVGCSAPGSSGWHWYNPKTWRKGRELTRVVETNKELDTAERTLIKKAQGTAHETQIALGEAPESKAVNVATESNNTTVANLDQVVGPMTAKALDTLRESVIGLTSEIVKIRTVSEKERQERREENEKSAQSFRLLQDRIEILQDDLAIGFARENAVANQHRNWKFWGLVIGGIYLFIVIILPTLSRAFPVIRSIALAGQAIIAPFAVHAAVKARRVAGDLAGAITKVEEKLEKEGSITKDQAKVEIKEWVTEFDGTAAYVHQLKSEKDLL